MPRGYKSLGLSLEELRVVLKFYDLPEKQGISENDAWITLYFFELNQEVIVDELGASLENKKDFTLLPETNHPLPTLTNSIEQGCLTFLVDLIKEQSIYKNDWRSYSVLTEGLQVGESVKARVRNYFAGMHV